MNNKKEIFEKIADVKEEVLVFSSFFSFLFFAFLGPSWGCRQSVEGFE